MSSKTAFIVKYLMDTEVISVREETTLEEVLVLIRRYHIADFPVVDAESKFQGMVYEQDLVEALYPEAAGITENIREVDMEEAAVRAKNKTVREIMTKDVVAVGGDDHVMKVAFEMINKKLPRVPVLRNSKVAGMLSQNRIFTEIMGRAMEMVQSVEHAEVKLEAPRKKETEDLGKRMFKRVDVHMVVAYKMTGEKGEEKQIKGSLAHVVNISAGGLLIRTKEELRHKTLLDIAFDLYHTNQPIKRLCRVVRSVPSHTYPGQYETGLMLLAVSADEQQKIDIYLDRFKK